MADKQNRKYLARKDVEPPSVTTEQRPAPLSPFDAKQAIHAYLINGYVVPTRHCRDRMALRNVSTQDVAYVLRHGAIIDQPKWNADHQNYVYKVEGYDLEDDELKVLSVIIDVEVTVLIVTVI
jgi:hypothetical protein